MSNKLEKGSCCIVFSKGLRNLHPSIMCYADGLDAFVCAPSWSQTRCKSTPREVPEFCIKRHTLLQPINQNQALLITVRGRL